MPEKTTKTDNHNAGAKLALRRYFLEKYHRSEHPSVLDCCQGSMLLWGTLRNEIQVSSYLGVDLKPKPGRLKVDSLRILKQENWDFDVIDVDTYGEPWNHYEAICKNITKPITVFLTISTIAYAGGGNISKAMRRGLGVHHLENLPRAICGKIGQKSIPIMLQSALSLCRVVECVEAVSTGNARYIGIRLEKHDGGQNYNCLDGSHLQPLDGLPESFGRVQELLRRNLDQESHGFESVGKPEDNQQTSDQGTMGERPKVESRGKGTRRKQ